MADIFISYARENRDTALELARQIEALGLTVWWDRSLLAGGDFYAAIESEIGKARKVIVLWSKEASTSGWVRSEADEAAQQQKLLPIRIDNSKVPLGFRHLHTIDLIEADGRIGEILRSLDLLHFESCNEPATPAPQDEADPAALNELAAEHYCGVNVPKNDQEAVRLWSLSASQGDVVGLNNLGSAYEDGEGGLAKDDVEAVRLYRLAADQGYAPAQANLGVAYGKGQGGLPKDEAEAVRLFRLAADQSSPHGLTNLGIAYARGLGGLSNSDVEAVKLYLLAAAQGYAPAQANLGAAYETGLGGLPKDEAEAVRLYRLAADQGNPAGQAFLAEMYERGVGGLQLDLSEACRLYRLAHEQGNDYALQALRRLGEN